MMVKLMEVVLRGFPKSSYDLDEDLRPYHKYRHELHIASGEVGYKDRAVIPTRLRPQVLETIHAAWWRTQSSGPGYHRILSTPEGVA